MKNQTIFRYSFLITLVTVGVLLFQCAAQYQKATVRSTPPLDYPLEAQMEQREGVVGLAVYVSGDSMVKTVELDESSGFADLDSVAVQFAKEVQFNPARKGRETVPSWTRLNVNFRLDKTSTPKEERLKKFKAYHKQIASFKDEEKRNTALEALYKLSTNLMGSVSLNAGPKINEPLKKVVSEQIYQYWQPLDEAIPLTFVVLDDYLYRYPKSPRYDDAKSRLIEYLGMLKDEMQKVQVDQELEANKAKVIGLIEQRVNQLKDEPVSSVL
ncbi:MAG: energy transducer TonB [candidate division KSB1 bacterium]|nr:energy transducer TonB [candidate division KSB1 bacterium]